MNFPGFIKGGCAACSSGHICNISGIAAQSLSEMEFEKGAWGAALRGNLGKVQELIRSKPDRVNEPDNYGFSPLHYAATEGVSRVIVDCLAYSQGFLDICAFLLKSGANPNMQTSNSWATPLHRASYRGHLNIVEVLVTNGADPLIQDIDGNTALHKACNNNQQEVVRYLMENYPNLKEVANNKGALPAVS